MASDRILIVDDDTNILESFRRRFSAKLEVYTSAGPKEALESISKNGPFAVVVSDYRMPVMNGIELLSRVKKTQPDTVRILLTGYADLNTAIEAVNQGNIFRMLTKPCPSDVMIKALAEGIKQYRLLVSEHDLLENTLRGAIQMLTELLSMAKPDAFGRTSRIESLVRKLALIMDVAPMWEIELAASLSQIGLFVFPDRLIRRISTGKSLAAEERELFASHPQTAAELISNIPRLDYVSQIVLYQEKRFDGSGIPDDSVCGEDIPLGSRIIKLAIDFDALIQSGKAIPDALHMLKQNKHFYDPDVLSALEEVLAGESKFAIRKLSISELKDKMILADDIYSTEPAKKLLAKGHQLTPSILHYLKQLSKSIGIEEPIRIIEPLSLQ